MAELDITPERRRAQRVSAGLCANCRHLRLMSNGRSTFIRCGRADRLTSPGAPTSASKLISAEKPTSAQDKPGWARYPRLPVVDCHGFESSTQ